MISMTNAQWPQLLEGLLVLAYLLAALTAAAHAMLNKRDPRAAWGWIAVCWLFPLVGPFLYLVFGINRISLTGLRSVIPVPERVDAIALPGIVGVSPADVRELVRITEALTGQPLVIGNQIEVLFNGDEAYPAMLQAIGQARENIALATYIFKDDTTGRAFAAALAAAQARGVKVRILLDGLSDFYYRPRASTLLRRHGLEPVLFLPPRLFPPMLHVNLRNHRKLLIVDGKLGFTGGINISEDNHVQTKGDKGIQDLHFRLQGAVVRELQAVFASDWQLASGEVVSVDAAGDGARHAMGPGQSVARVIRDGPNDGLNTLELVLQGALASAHNRVWIMTPYLLPGPGLLGSLQSAALRGVEVRILIPEHSDQPWMDWATQHMLWQLLQHHVSVYYRPGPFAHSKLILVDDYYLQFGTANLDSRSLRLNFELMVETYDVSLSRQLSQHFSEACAQARLALLSDLDARPLPTRLRDGFVWLFSPFL
jgi:cardiolipin synthase A/B